MQSPLFKQLFPTWVPAMTLIFLMLFCCGAMSQDEAKTRVWVGTHGNQLGLEAGVYRAELFSDEDSISPPKLVRALKGAGWVAASPCSSQMYATGHVKGKAVVVSFDGADDNSSMNPQEIGDGGSCFVTTDKTGRILISAQYGGGSIAVFPIDAAGRLQPRSQLLEHQGGSRVVGNRQNSPHPHYVAISPDNRFAFVPDLGLDQLVVYRIYADKQKLEPVGSVDVEPGGGPRHMKFHPSGNYAFVLNELSMSVTTFKYETKPGRMTKLRTVPTLNQDEQNLNSFNSASEIRVHKAGAMVVTANRGHDSLSVFRFDVESGDLQRIQLESMRGSWPRNFNFSPDGNRLIAAGRDSNSLTMFAVTDSGTLRYMQHKSAFVPAPICVCFE